MKLTASTEVIVTDKHCLNRQLNDRSATPFNSLLKVQMPHFHSIYSYIVQHH